MSRVRLVEPIPDQAMVVVVGAAGDDDLRARWNERLALGPFASGDEVAAVDHRGGQMLVADLRAGAWPPRRAGVALVVGGGLVAQELEGVPSLDKRVALGRQSLQFDGADLRAVLGLLAAALRLLVVVELAFDAIDRAVEEVDRRPEERVEIGLEPRVGEGRDERVEDVGDGGGRDARLGHGAWIGVAVERSMSV